MKPSVEVMRELLAALVDTIVLPGHALTLEQWENICLFSGRFCEPFLGFGRNAEQKDALEEAQTEMMQLLLKKDED